MDEGTTRIRIINDTLAVHELNHFFRIKYKTADQPKRNRRCPENVENTKHGEEISLSSEIQSKPLDMTGKQSSNVIDKTEENTTPDDSCGI
jgi:hypothetical protein